MNLALMSDAADVDRVRQDLVDMPPAEQAAARRAACAIDADRDPKALGIESLVETHDASSLEIAAKEGAYDLGMILDDVQCAILDPIAQAGRRRPSTSPSSSKRRSCRESARP